MRLGGPLWRDRTVRGGDGARDFAEIGGDEHLGVQIRGARRARVATVELRVDGRRQQVVRARCASGQCPASVTLTFVPRLRQLPFGEHRVEVVARDPVAAANANDSGPHLGVAALEVWTAAHVPAAAEVESVGKLPVGSGASPSRPALMRSALGVLATERRRNRGLARALKGAQVRVVLIGDLNVSGRHLGATMLVRLVSPIRDVRATVPAFIPGRPRSDPPYTLQQVRMHVAVLRDALIDVDLGTRRVIAFEPGTRSQAQGWSPSREPAPSGAADED
jgi:hypothetical protein